MADAAEHDLPCRRIVCHRRGVEVELNGGAAMWKCPKCQSTVDDSFDVCWSCGTSADGVEDPGFVTADEAELFDDDATNDEKPKASRSDDEFAGTIDVELVECYMASNTIEAKFIADRLMEQGIPAIADEHDINLVMGGFQPSLWGYGPKIRVVPKTWAELKHGSRTLSSVESHGKPTWSEASCREAAQPYRETRRATHPAAQNTNVSSSRTPGDGRSRDSAPERRQRRRIAQPIALKWLASTAQNAFQRRGCAVPRRGCAAGLVSTCRSCRFSGSIR